MTEFSRIETSRGPVTSEQTAEFHLIRAAAIIRACGTLGLAPYERDTADRDVLAAALAEARGTQASDILADLDEEITTLAGAYLATYRNSGGQAAAALDTIAPGIPASPTAARSRGQNRTVRFRFDPGHLFERHGYITDNQDGTCNLGILQRYRPGDDLEWVIGTDRTEAEEIPSRLAELAGHASEKAVGLPHWRVAVPVSEPHLAADWPDDVRDAFGIAATTAAAMARYKRAFWYLYRDDVGLIDANNPPPLPADVWSVSPRGEWSLHTDLATWPLDRDPAALQAATTTGAEVIAEWAECAKPASLDWTFRMASRTHDLAGAAVTQSARLETSPRKGRGR